MEQVEHIVEVKRTVKVIANQNLSLIEIEDLALEELEKNMTFDISIKAKREIELISDTFKNKHSLIKE